MPLVDRQVFVRGVDGAYAWTTVQVELSDEQIAAEANEATVRERGTAALAANRAFLDLAAPTNAQTLAQVKRLTRECSALIRLALRALDTIDDT